MSSVRERILQRVNPELLKMTPKLSGNAGSFIDLDTEDSLEDGVKNLMMRFFRNQDLCEKNKRKSTQNPTELTISTARHDEKNEICEVVSERLTLPFVRNEEDEVFDRPGKKLQKLKMELQEKMSAKWEEEYKKRVNEKKMYNESGHKERKKSVEDEEDEEIDPDADKPEPDEGEDATEKDNEEEDSDIDYEGDESDAASVGSNKSDEASIASDEPNEIDLDDNQEDKPVRCDEYDSNDACSLVPAYQPGGGMLNGGSELTQSDEGLPRSLLSPSLRLSLNELCASKTSSESQSVNEATLDEPQNEGTNSFLGKKNKLFSQVQNDSFDLSDAFEFCSGKFPDADQSKLQLETENVEENLEGSGVDSDDEFQSSFGEELDEDSQPTVESENKENTKARKNIITFEDSEAEEEEKEVENEFLSGAAEESTGLKVLSDDEDNVADEEERVKKKKTRKSLHFSDEEESDSEVEEDGDNTAASEKEEEEEAEEEDEQRSVHYDSEENEIINPKEFFEKEAELSGSECSGDEDEKGLDEFDVEEGDADKLDDDEVRSQLGKIHMRRILDDDAREVRLIQEILFEDGDLHSDGKRRDRKFRWKNLGTFNEEGKEMESKKEEANDSSDDGGPEEEEMRKMRHEKELFLMTKNKKDGDLSSDEEIVEDFHSIRVTSVKTSIKLAARSENAVETCKPITDYTNVVKTNVSQNPRGSFLTRNEEFLSKLAKATSGVTDNVLGPKSSKNFVFATKSPEKKPDKTTACKRQVKDSGSCNGRDKRIKLLPPEINTGPSIFDFLV